MNRSVPIALVSLALPLACGSSASAALLFDQFAGTGATTNAYSSQLSTGGTFSFASQVADDFSLAANATVQKIRFWGAYFNGVPAPISSFNVLVYADAGGQPTGTPGDPTGTALHSFSVSATVLDTGAPFSLGSSNILQYDVSLGAGFLATAGTTYWIAIQAVVDFPPQWGWASQAVGGGDPLGQWMPYAGFTNWRTNVHTEHTQFQLFSGTGGVIPLPGAAGLAALGLVGVTGRRRR